MRKALDLAALGRGKVSPNPLVGALVVQDDAVLGQGWHAGPGTPHAEIHALRAAGSAARGSTVVCTLEPCDHHGRTPPCADALIEAGVARVIVATTDPNPLVDGKGLDHLRAAGVEIVTGVLAREARRANEAYFAHVATGRPFVTLKMAASLDGKSAARDGSSRWITGRAARADVHRLRADADAVLVGAGTAVADDPSLTVRDIAFDGPPPLRVLVDASGRVSADGRLFDGSAPSLVATTERAPGPARAAWERAGAEVCVLDTDRRGVDLASLMDLLGKRDLQGVLLEGGPTLAWSAIDDGLVDKVILYSAPVLIGGVDAPGVLGGPGFASIRQAARLELAGVERIGGDVRSEAYVHRDR